MSYTSGDWTARQRYLLSSSLCFPQEDPNALLEFINGTRSNSVFPCGCTEPFPMPFFPVYNGTPASMQFASTSYTDISDSSANICSITLVTDVSGKLGIWGTLDASGAPFTIELVLNGTIVTQSSTSPYIFFGTAAVMPNGSYTAILRCNTSGFLDIARASIMMVGRLS